MKSVGLVMPMAGRGSRFSRQGYSMPKPLVPLFGRPFYVWAVESVRSKLPVDEMVFVILREHAQAFALDRDIIDRYPRARIVQLDAVTSGAAETAALGVSELRGTSPFAINDCDHAFDATGLEDTVEALSARSMTAALVCFRSSSSAFSYVELDGAGHVSGTVEKKVVSPFAIAGCYLFGSKAVFDEHYATYRTNCAYDELFMSGVYNTLTSSGGSVRFHELRRHVPFGTPEEMACVDVASLIEVTSARGA